MARIGSLLRLKIIRDQWQLREATYNQFVGNSDDDAISDVTGGHAVVLEDRAADRWLISNTLACLDARVTFAETLAEAVTLAQQDDCDLVFASLNLKMRVPVESDHGFRWKMIAQSGGT